MDDMYYYEQIPKVKEYVQNLLNTFAEYEIIIGAPESKDYFSFDNVIISKESSHLYFFGGYSVCDVSPDIIEMVENLITKCKSESIKQQASKQKEHEKTPKKKLFIVIREEELAKQHAKRKSRIQEHHNVQLLGCIK